MKDIVLIRLFNTQKAPILPSSRRMLRKIRLSGCHLSHDGCPARPPPHFAANHPIGYQIFRVNAAKNTTLLKSFEDCNRQGLEVNRVIRVENHE